MTLGINMNTYRRVSTRKNSQGNVRNYCFGQIAKEKVINYWLGASIEYPCKRRVKKIQSIFMLTSKYISVYQDFRRRHPEKIGFIKFHQLRPSNIQNLQVSERNVCFCPKCENAKFIVQAMNQACQMSSWEHSAEKGEGSSCIH